MLATSPEVAACYQVTLFLGLGDSSDSVTIKFFLLESSKSGVWEYFVSLPQMENANPNFNFTILSNNYSLKAIHKIAYLGLCVQAF